MLRLLADENFNEEIVRGLILRVVDAGHGGMSDAEILAWAAANDRIVLTHDHATMPRQAYERVSRGGPMSGVFLLRDRLAIGQAIEEIVLMLECSEQDEWTGCVVYLPLR
ncbi:DUF5615 family PIN-like protein [bacterium]|nr:DUF5615 family PIN-like protein [bacterium]